MWLPRLYGTDLSGLCGKRITGTRSGRGVNQIIRNSTEGKALGAEDTSIRVVLDFVLANVKNDERPYLNVDVLGREVLGLLDTGASRTIVGQEGFKLIESLGLKLKPSIVDSCNVADGKRCEVIGCYEVPFKLLNRVVILDTLVVPSLSHTLILGADFFRKMGVVPDLRSNHWTFAEMPEQPRVATLTDNSRLSGEQAKRLDELVAQYFGGMTNKLGCTTLVKHAIKTKSEPIKQRFYPISPALQRYVNAELQEMLEQGVVEPSSSPWSSPIVMVKKKDGSYRFCVDFRKLNKVTERDAYPLPFVTHTLDKLRDATFLTSLDIKSAYWQVPLTEESKPLTAFTIPGRGLFQFCRMPMGLHNSSATWQRLVDNVLGAGLEPYVFVYLDDIVIVTREFDKHLEILREVFERLRAANLTLSRDKCHFCRRELKFLGYVIDEGGLHVDPEKVSAILNLPVPRNVKEVRRILGMTSWYRRFIPNYATVVSPINNLLRKNTKFQWDESCAIAFDKLKGHLVSAPIMNCPDFDRPFCIQTDASDYGLGATLTQEYPEGERVICYISRSLNRNERRFSCTEKECLAVVWAVEKFRPYIEATHFTVITDHFALKWLNSLTDPSGRLARWSVRLQQFDFEVLHRRGKDNVVPDALSRAVPIIDEVEVAEPLIEFPDITDRWYLKMRESVAKDPLNHPLWRVNDGQLYKKTRASEFETGQNSGWKLVVPKSYRKGVIATHHEVPTAGHCGVWKTFHRVMLHYYWPKMKTDITHYVRTCSTCIQQKPEQKAPAGLLSGRPEVTQPWEMLSIDVVGPLPKSSSGYIYILSIQDYFSKFCLFLPMRNQSAKTISRLLEEHIFLLFGVPRILISDNGRNFTGSEFRNLLKSYGVKFVCTPYYHPESNPCERQHRTVKTMLASYVRDNHREWDKFLPKVACAIRTAKHESTGQSPYAVNFGREMTLHGNYFKLRDKTPDSNTVNRPPDFGKLFEDVRSRLDKAFQRSQRVYNLRRRDVQYQVGDRVWHKNHILSNASQYFTAKLAPKFVGPFVVSKKVSPWAYELKDLDGKPGGLWNVRDLKPDAAEKPQSQHD